MVGPLVEKLFCGFPKYKKLCVREAVHELGRRVRREVGDVNILVNNAGIRVTNSCLAVWLSIPSEIFFKKEN